MKNILLTGAALLAMTAASVAADLPGRGPAYAPAPVYAAAPVFTWSGIYVGATAGYASNKYDADHDDDVYYSGSTNTLIGRDAKGTVFGATLGWNRQFGRMVVGLETDLSWSTTKTSMYSQYSGGGYDGDWPLEARIEHFSTMRARLGYAVTPTALLYVTGGLAYKSTSLNIPDEPASKTFNTFGYALGAGLEYMVSPNWSVKAEYLYLGFSKSYDISNMPDGNDGDFFKVGNTHVARVGVNYRFGGLGAASSAPVLARY